MKRRIYIYILTAVAIIMGVACNKAYLERPPLDRLNSDAYWKTSGDLDRYVLQFYPLFPRYGVDLPQQGIFAADARNGSDDMIMGNPNTMLNGTRPTPTSEWQLWNHIRSVNIVFENHHRISDDFLQYRHFLGEAYFFKAWLYFNLVRRYGDVPWLVNSLQTDSEELYKPRDPRTMVIDSVLTHLDKAIEYLNSLDNSSAGNNRLSKETALLFKSRVALFEGSWQKYHAGTDFATPGADAPRYFTAAASAAEELMQGGYTADIYNTGEPGGDYYYLFGQDDYADNKEIFLWLKYDGRLNMRHNSQEYLVTRTAEVAVTLDLVRSYLGINGLPYDYDALQANYEGNDFLLKLSADIDPRLRQTIWIPGDVKWNNVNGYNVFDKPTINLGGEFLCRTGFQLKKGSNPFSNGAGIYGNSETGGIIFRYAEALLNYAEAKAELNTLTQEDVDKTINVLRNRAGLPLLDINAIPVDPAWDFPEYSPLLNEVRRERRVELACEGFRSDDLRRWAAHRLFMGRRPLGYPFKSDEWGGQQISVPRNGDGLLDPFQAVMAAGYGFNPNRDYLEGIPLNEIAINPQLAQNPGW